MNLADFAATLPLWTKGQEESGEGGYSLYWEYSTTDSLLRVYIYIRHIRMSTHEKFHTRRVHTVQTDFHEKDP